jgi:hypothetical protein
VVDVMSWKPRPASESVRCSSSWKNKGKGRMSA